MGKHKELQGVVVRDKMTKTVVVRVVRKVKHPTYDRIIKTYRKFKVHDEKQEAKAGDEVRIIQTRPLSKEKKFRILSIVKKASMPAAEIKD
jgi:small subunit ribosomal protein S17